LSFFYAISHRKEGSRGYAIALEGLVTYINDLLPNSETIGEVYRQTNALINLK
jgi:hypothetical protein